MAKTYKGLKIVLGADVTTLQQALRTVNKDAKTFAGELNLINSALKLNPTNAELLHQKMELLSKSAETAREKFQKLNQAQSQLAEKHNNGTLSDEQWRAYNRELERARSNLQSFEHQIEILNTVNIAGNSTSGVQNLNKALEEINAENLKKSAEQAKELENAVSDGNKALDAMGTKAEEVKSILIKAVAVISTAVSALIAKSVQAGANFEEAMSQVSATMGIDSTAEDYERLSDIAKEMGATTKFTATQAGEALNYLALAGYDADKQISALPLDLNLASAGGMELAEASNMVTNSMSALGISTSELSGFSDKLAKTAQKSNTDVAQLGEAIIMVGSTAKILSGGTTELNTALGILADNGIKAQEGGTALRQIILNLTTPTDVAKKKMQELGISAFNADGSIKPLNQTFAELDKAMSGFTDEQKMSAIGAIFDSRQLKSANALLANYGDRWNELSGYISNADGACEQMAKTMSDNLKGDVVILQSAFEGLGITVSESFDGSLRKSVQMFSDEISSLNDSLQNGGLQTALDRISYKFRNMIESIAGFTVNNALPSIVNLFEYIADHGESIANTATAIVTAFSAQKLAKNLQSTITYIQTLQKAFKALKNESVMASSAVAEMASKLTLSAGIAGLTACTTAVVGIVNHINQAKKEAERLNEEFVTSAKKSAESYENISTLTNQYTALGKVTDRTSQQEKTYKKLQEEIIAQLGDRKSALEGLTEGSDEYLKKLEELTAKETEQYRNSINQGVESAKNALPGYTQTTDFISYMIGDKDSIAREIETIVSDAVGEANLSKSGGALTGHQASLLLSGDAMNDAEMLKKSLDALNAKYEEYRKSGESDKANAIITSDAYKKLQTTYDEYNRKITDYIVLKTKQAEIDYTERNGIPKTAEEFEKMKTAVLGAVNCTENYTDVVTENIAAFKSVSDTVSDTTSSVVQSVTANNNYIDSLEDIVSVAEEFKKSAEEIKSDMNLINSAVSEQAKNNRISADTAEKLIDSGYSVALSWDNESGACSLLTDKIKSLLQEKYKKIQADISERQNSLAEQYENESKALEKLRSNINSVADAEEYRQKLKEHESTKSSLDTAAAYKNLFSQAYRSNDENTVSEASKDIAQQEIANLDYYYNLGKISAQDYYSGLLEIDRKYYADNAEYLSEHRSLVEKTYSGLKNIYEENFNTEKDWLDYSLATSQVTIQDYYSQLQALINKYYANQSEYADKYAQYQKIINQGLIDFQKQAFEDEKTALQANNTERKKSIELQQAEIDLENAKNNLIRTYSSDRGFYDTADEKAIQTAQSKLDDLITDQQIDAIEANIKALEANTEAFTAIKPFEKAFNFAGSGIENFIKSYASLKMPDIPTNNNSVSVKFSPQITINGNPSAETIEKLNIDIRQQFDICMKDFLTRANLASSNR